MHRVVVLVSGGGTNLQCLIDAVEKQTLPGVKIVGVIASREGIMALKRAQKAGLATRVVSRRAFEREEDYHATMLQALNHFAPDLIVLAGFLSLLGQTSVAAYRGRIINVHPSLIPAFCGPGLYGLKVHEAVLEYGAKITGATVHLVDEHYDTGPIVLQKAVPVLAGDTPRSLQRRVMQEGEQVLLPQAVKLFAEDKVRVQGRITTIKEDPKR